MEAPLFVSTPLPPCVTERLMERDTLEQGVLVRRDPCLLGKDLFYTLRWLSVQQVSEKPTSAADGRTLGSARLPVWNVSPISLSPFAVKANTQRHEFSVRCLVLGHAGYVTRNGNGREPPGLPGAACLLSLTSGLQTGSQFKGEDPARSCSSPASRLSTSQ